MRLSVNSKESNIMQISPVIVIPVILKSKYDSGKSSLSPKCWHQLHSIYIWKFKIQNWCVLAPTFNRIQSGIIYIHMMFWLFCVIVRRDRHLWEHLSASDEQRAHLSELRLQFSVRRAAFFDSQHLLCSGRGLVGFHQLPWHHQYGISALSLLCVSRPSSRQSGSLGLPVISGAPTKLLPTKLHPLILPPPSQTVLVMPH